MRVCVGVFVYVFVCMSLSVFVCVVQVPHHEGLLTRRNFEQIAENFMKMKEFWDFWEFQGAIHPVLCPPVEKTLSCV